MPLLRSVLHLAWMLITVIPWGLALVLLSVGVRRTPLWWFAVGWFRVVIWGTRGTIDASRSFLEKAAAFPTSLCARSVSLSATIVITMPRPARRVISSWLRASTSKVPPPTVPMPSKPTLMGFITNRPYETSL